MRPAGIGDEMLLQSVLDEASGVTGSSIFGDGAKELLIAHRVYLGFVRGIPVGCVMASVADGSAIIHNLAVSRSHRNRGHATTLVKSAMARLDGARPLDYWAAADPANPSAVNRFSLLGFEPHGPSTREGLVLMLRKAGAPSPRTTSTDTASLKPFRRFRTASAGPNASASND